MGSESQISFDVIQSIAVDMVDIGVTGFQVQNKSMKSQGGNSASTNSDISKRISSSWRLAKKTPLEPIDLFKIFVIDSGSLTLT